MTPELNQTDDADNKFRMAFYLSQLAQMIHKQNVEVGWWDDAVDYGGRVPDAYLVPTKLALAHSEISEGLEGFRKGLMDDHLPIHPMVMVEIADTIIRLLDLAAYLHEREACESIGPVTLMKVGYNAGREDHKREARRLEGGKSV